jgi:hypothetical protein
MLAINEFDFNGNGYVDVDIYFDGGKDSCDDHIEIGGTSQKHWLDPAAREYGESFVAVCGISEACL